MHAEIELSSDGNQSSSACQQINISLKHYDQKRSAVKITSIDLRCQEILFTFYVLLFVSHGSVEAICNRVLSKNTNPQPSNTIGFGV